MRNRGSSLNRRTLAAFPKAGYRRSVFSHVTQVHPYCTLAHILLIENEDAHLIEMALARASVPQHVTVARAGQDAITMLDELAASAETIPDLILVGVNGADSDGFEVLAHVKSHPRLRAVPVVALTSSQAASVLEKAYRMHANCCIHKRNTPEELFVAIDALCRFWLQTATLPRTPWWS
jgi:chemotaxis family two-component system response regulator Rcp1